MDTGFEFTRYTDCTEFQDIEVELPEVDETQIWDKPEDVVCIKTFIGDDCLFFEAVISTCDRTIAGIYIFYTFNNPSREK